MNNKTSSRLLSAMFFNVSFFQSRIPALIIGDRRFKIDFDVDDGSNIIVRTYDDFFNEQVIFFSTRLMAVESMTQLSTKEEDALFSGLIHRTVIPKKLYSEFDTYRILKQFNLYVQYIIFSFNYMHWR
jgi:hypothetical protein